MEVELVCLSYLSFCPLYFLSKRFSVPISSVLNLFLSLPSHWSLLFMSINFHMPCKVPLDTISTIIHKPLVLASLLVLSADLQSKYQDYSSLRDSYSEYQRKLIILLHSFLIII